MDLNDLRSLATVLMFLLFVGIVVWAWSRKRVGDFASAQQLPFEGDAGARTQSGD